MKLLDVTGYEAIEMLADLIDPIQVIATDTQVMQAVQSKQNLKAIKYALKNETKQVLELMAICEGVPVEEYKPTIAELPAKILEILNHPDIARLFTTQAQTAALDSGSATDNTVEKA